MAMMLRYARTAAVRGLALRRTMASAAPFINGRIASGTLAGLRCSSRPERLNSYAETASIISSIQRDKALPDMEVSRVSGREDIALLEMQHAPVNALSLDFLTQLTEAFTALEKDREVQGVVLASGLPKIFSAGLDIREMYDKDEAHLRNFWGTLQSLWIQLMTTRLAVAAAIEGHSPAGGCLLSLTADERIMTKGKYSIGLNETRLGIIAPRWFIDSFRFAVGQRQADRMLQLGEMVSPTEALAVGLVDQVVASGEVRGAAVTALDRYLQVPAMARHQTKIAVRMEAVNRLANDREADMQHFIGLITQPVVQKGLGKYLASLSQRAKEKPLE